jgi:hypothetical protein
MCQRRVLLDRMEGEVRQVQFCKWTTTIEMAAGNHHDKMATPRGK